MVNRKKMKFRLTDSPIDIASSFIIHIIDKLKLNELETTSQTAILEFNPKENISQLFKILNRKDNDFLIHDIKLKFISEQMNPGLLNKKIRKFRRKNLDSWIKIIFRTPKGVAPYIRIDMTTPYRDLTDNLANEIKNIFDNLNLDYSVNEIPSLLAQHSEYELAKFTNIIMTNELLEWSVNGILTDILVSNNNLRFLMHPYKKLEESDNKSKIQINIPRLFIVDDELVFLYLIGRLKCQMQNKRIRIDYIETSTVGSFFYVANSKEFSIKSSDIEVQNLLLELLFTSKKVIFQLNDIFQEKLQIFQTEFELSDSFFQLFQKKSLMSKDTKDNDSHKTSERPISVMNGKTTDFSLERNNEDINQLETKNNDFLITTAIEKLQSWINKDISNSQKKSILDLLSY